MSNRKTILPLSSICLLFVGLSVCGISWGLPGREIDPYLFGGGEVWSGEKIYRLAGAGAKFDTGRGADVDADPAAASTEQPVLLTGSEEDVARIYLRYRLYTHQPDEMIVMMALGGMKPRELDFDPRLYQYGGLFIYPVGAMVYAAKLFGLIDVRSDVVYYLDHPEEFGRFYIVARAYAAAWGVLGLLIVYGIARRLAGPRAGLLAALLFALMPVVICMAHEGKPHLPGAVLMLAAVLFAMRYVAAQAGAQPAGRRRDWWLMCACCGASFAMVLSSWPIFVLIPLVPLTANRAATVRERLARRKPAHFLTGAARKEAHTHALSPAVQRTMLGFALAVVVYLVSNPYIVINAIVNREVLASNFGNSLAMYEIDRIAEGSLRVVDLTIEGSTLIVAVLGTAALIAAIPVKMFAAIPLAVPALLFFLQFVLIGAGKPAEYGRFGIFPDTALAIGTACLVAIVWDERRKWVLRIAAALVVGLVGWHGLRYLWNFRIDTGDDHSRIRLARSLSHWEPDADSPKFAIALTGDPAPYGCPPINFSKHDVYLVRHSNRAPAEANGKPMLLIQPVDDLGWSLRDLEAKPLGNDILPKMGATSFDATWPGTTPISWANKPFRIAKLSHGETGGTDNEPK